MTKNQYNFVYELSRKILNINQKNLLIEIPPTLDKDFLYCSVLFSLYFYKLLQKKKVIIIVNDYEKIRYIYNNFNILKKHFLLNKKKTKIYIYIFIIIIKCTKKKNFLYH
jgi:hypothetical protein